MLQTQTVTADTLALTNDFGYPCNIFMLRQQASVYGRIPLLFDRPCF